MSDIAIESSGLKILFLTKWYPNRYDPQIGVFIKKHAVSVSKFCEVAVLHVYSDSKLAEKKYELISEKEGNLLSVVVYYRKFSALFSLLNRPVNLIRYWKATFMGLNYIRKNFGDHDLSHAYILLRPALVAYYLKHFRKKPFIVSEQWSGYATGKYEKRPSLVKAMTRFILKQADAVTVVSEFLKKHMIRNGLNGHFTVIPNIIETPSTLHIQPFHQKTRILLVADLVDEIKNVSGVIKAVSEIAATNSNLELNIVGEGIDRKRLTAFAEELNLLNRYVFFHGLKSNAEVYQYLQKSDFLVMNSNFETFSLICAEAISCGKPVVATRCGGPQEFVNEENGKLIDPGNQAQLVKAIREMLVGYQHYAAENLIQQITHKFSSETVGKKFLDVYLSIVRNKKS